MKISMQIAVLAALVSLPNVGMGQEKDGSNDLDEIVVIGRSVTTGTTRVEVERKLLVDSATVLKEIPGANAPTTNPLLVTSSTARLVKIRFTTPFPVRGKVQFSTIFGSPFFVWCWLTT